MKPSKKAALCAIGCAVVLVLSGMPVMAASQPDETSYLETEGYVTQAAEAPEAIAGQPETALTPDAEGIIRGNGWMLDTNAGLMTLTADQKEMSVDEYPWYPFRDQIQELAVAEGVTRIPRSMCAEFPKLRKVTLASTVEEISQMAFNNCAALSEVYLNEGLRVIANHVFTGDVSLTSIDIPSTVETIGWDCFTKCTGLTEFRVPASVTSMEDCFYGSGISRVIFEEGRSVIPEKFGFMFRGMNQAGGVVDVYIPQSVTSIEWSQDSLGEGGVMGLSIRIHGYRGSAAEKFLQQDWMQERVNSGAWDFTFVPAECETHTWDAGVVTQEPTLDAEGVRTFTCTVCGAVKTEAIPKLTAPTEPSETTPPEQNPSVPETPAETIPQSTAAAEEDNESPQTGDSSNILVWLGCLAAAGFVMAGTVCSKKKISSRR